MHVKFISVAGRKGRVIRGPSEYFMRKTNSQGKVRNPKPRQLFGDFHLFEKVIRFSKAKHPYSSYSISYRNEPVLPSFETRAQIHGDFLKMLRGGLAESNIYAIGVDHGDHEHGAILRHVVSPKWPQFSPYFHAKDKELLSMFQWLVNRRYGFRAPENPANEQLLSLAGKHPSIGDREFIEGLRGWVNEEWDAGHFTDHQDFITRLRKRVRRVDVVHMGVGGHLQRPNGETSSGATQHLDKRVYLEVARGSTRDEIVTRIKGPLCAPSFRRDQHDADRAKRVAKYESFLMDPMPLWEDFATEMKRRRARHLARFVEYCGSENQDLIGFDNLHPNNHVAQVGPRKAHVVDFS